VILIVLASGRGRRLEKLTSDKPKCLIKVNQNQTLIENISKNFEFFEKVIVVTGYKSKIIKKKLNGKNISFVHNKNYLKSNMVESLMLTKNYISNHNIIVTYSDIYFDPLIIKKLIKKKQNVLPLNKNWFSSWKKRYGTISRIKEDAEDVKVKGNKIVSIGEKIKDKMPKYQFMGILKINNYSFKNLNKFYKKLNNKNISTTEFINKSIINNVAKFNYCVESKFWCEVDNYNDLKYLQNQKILF
tara:strand:- start:965 stop:1696 length:732 start_codon:yes stop_codon:yes gene_type:complete